MSQFFAALFMTVAISAVLALWSSEKERRRTGSKYSILELFFGNRWKWVRKRSGSLWLKADHEGAQWLKFTTQELFSLQIRGFSMLNRPGWQYEDWRQP